jgi:hypothetical protein
MAAVRAGHTVLAPNAEMAAALFDAVERTHLEARRDIWPTPRVRDFGGWLREKHLDRQLMDAAVSRVLSDLEERELWREVVESSGSGQDSIESTGAAGAAPRPPRAL